ncbi:MAG: HDIG domain-containing protein [Verrucomicrobia bacterium]|nr:HDIG domain-containing protein [Verrucomicrobiota bacterium]MDA1065948.1 HDIG domain-containing protein [Verrucomicrobiota bacterium]
MKLFSKRKQLKDKPSPSRRKRRTLRETWTKTFLATSPVVTTVILLTWVLLTIVLAFTGVTPAGIQVQRDQVSRVRVVAEKDFSYESKLHSEQRKALEMQRIPPVYRLDMKQYEAFRDQILELLEEINAFEIEIADLEPDEKLKRVEDFTLAFEERTKIRLNVEDVFVILARTEVDDRKPLFEDSLVSVRRILGGGIFDPTDAVLDKDPENLNFINVQRDSGQIRRLDIQSQDTAYGAMKRDFTYFDISQDLNIVLFRIMSQAIRPNLRYDQDLHEKAREKAGKNAEKVRVSVASGEIIIEPGETVLPFKYEMLLKYQEFLLAEDTVYAFSLGRSFWEKAMVILLLGFGVVVYLALAGWSSLTDNRRVSLLFIVILLNIAITRLLLNAASSNPETFALLRYMIPVYLGPILIALLINQRAAIFVAAVVCFITSLMFGESFILMSAMFLACLIAVLFCKDVRKRGQIVQSSIFGGITLAVGTFILGILNEVDLVTIGWEMLISVGVGAATGILVIGLLPFFEGIFKLTTNITLLELTDYNHRLLRRLQLEAPGSYHHSLMVANLAENGASAIGANPLVCRVCSIFHDIGKLIKPEYFAENQRDGDNPLILQNPSMAALVIKAHVKEGVNLAIRNKLPRIIIDVIKQHHGTSLITYFYVQALKGKKAKNEVRVEESTYRYDGPKPQFRESAVIFFADSVEAASRSLKKITPQSIDELIDSILEGKIADDQLSECPLTFEEIKKLKTSFSISLLNSLHSRIEYPDKEKAQADAQNADRKKENHSDIQSLQSV